MTHIFIGQFASETAEKEGFAALGFDPRAFIIQLITFLFVFYILYKFVFRRIVVMLEARRDAIDEGLRLTTQMQAERDKLEQEVTEARKSARREADEVLALTHERAGAIIKEAEDRAQAKVDGMMKDATKRITEESARARRKLEAEVVDLVIEATEVVAGEKLDAKKDAKLLESALKGQV
jgi:F-type H+-transporting ATPase subunit b